MPAELGSMSLGNSMQHEAAIRVATPDKVNATDYKFSRLGSASAKADTAPYY